MEGQNADIIASPLRGDENGISPANIQPRTFFSLSLNKDTRFVSVCDAPTSISYLSNRTIAVLSPLSFSLTTTIISQANPLLFISISSQCACVRVVFFFLVVKFIPSVILPRSHILLQIFFFPSLLVFSDLSMLSNQMDPPVFLLIICLRFLHYHHHQQE